MSKTRNDRKDQRRKAAIARQKKYDGLTTEQKVALAKSRRGHSRKELTKLHKGD